MTDRTTRDAKNASEGELLRDQLAEVIAAARIVHFNGRGAMHILGEDSAAADAVLLAFDVRLREPQAETFAVNRDEALYLVSWATAVKDAYPHGFADVDHALLARLQEFWQPPREPQAEET